MTPSTNCAEGGRPCLGGVSVHCDPDCPKRPVEERRVPGPPAPPSFEAPVVGVSFVPGHPRQLKILQQAFEAAGRRESANDGTFVPAALIRNPSNEYDSNAIEVHAAEVMVGHLKREVAAKLAPHLDAGVVYRAGIVRVRVHRDHPDNPGIDVRGERIR